MGWLVFVAQGAFCLLSNEGISFDMGKSLQYKNCAYFLPALHWVNRASAFIGCKKFWSGFAIVLVKDDWVAYRDFNIQSPTIG